MSDTTALDVDAAATAEGDERRDARRAWTWGPMVVTMGLTGFLTVSGLWIYLAGFSQLAQIAVLVHVALGLVFLVPYGYYQGVHLWRHLKIAMEAVLLLGWLSSIALAVCVASGLVLTWQAALGTRVDPVWRQVHVISTFATLSLVGFHVGLAAVRLAARIRAAPGGGAFGPVLRRFALSAGVVALGGLVVTGGWTLAYRATTYDDYQLPADYSYKYGTNPFAPSLAQIEGKKAVHPRLLADSRRCGTAGCHEQIYKEWQVSVHRWASADPSFQAVQKTMGENEGPESTRYCAGCHDPIALFSGSKNIYSADLSSYGADEGVSCVACHSITKTDVKGNANFTLTVQRRYAYELDSGPAAKWLSDFLIRAYPRYHVASFTRDLYKTAEYCAACHKQFIDKEINKFGWVQLQNQYDNWRKSHWNKGADPTRTITCRECHMRLVRGSTEPAAGDVQDVNRSAADGAHRSHMFIGANQVVPLLLENRLKLEGVKEHTRLTEEWLRGQTVIPEIQTKWTTGPAVPLEIVAPAVARAGRPLTVKVTATNNKVGHDFPTGPLDLIQCWIDFTATTEGGRTLLASGKVDDRHFIQEGSFLFKAEGIDQHGNLIDRHNLWDMVGARYRRSLFPGYSDAATYTFDVPPDAGAALSLEARLRYRKINQFLLNMVIEGRLADLSGARTTPITDMSWASLRVPVVDGRAPGDGPAGRREGARRPGGEGPTTLGRAGR